MSRTARYIARYIWSAKAHDQSAGDGEEGGAEPRCHEEHAGKQEDPVPRDRAEPVLDRLEDRDLLDLGHCDRCGSRGAGNVGVKFLVARSAPGRATAPAHLE